jgi:RsiW-degrading membrane proteinase PrsW (M82 family)
VAEGVTKAAPEALQGAVPGPPVAVHYAPRRPFWQSRAVRTAALFTALAVCGVVILAVVRHHIGTEPFLVGMALAVLPVPLLLWGYLWLDRVAPSPWQNVAFAFAWGACAATLVALFANEYGVKLIANTLSATPSQSDRWGATFVAPLVEETTKGTAILLLYLLRRRHIESLLDGIVLAGLVATGFAFTENILYLGTAFSEDQAEGVGVFGSTTFGTFVVRVLMTPFAHPLFTSMTGIGFAIAALCRPRSPWRWIAPVGGWLLAMVLHGSWNGSAQLSPMGFLIVYVSVMIPAFGLVVWLAFWARAGERRTIRVHLAPYAAAGWLAPREPVALSSMRVRGDARDLARRLHGDAGGRAVRDYAAYATHLAFLRAAATRGLQPPDFAARESELLQHLWHGRALAQPALLQSTPLPWPPPYPQSFPQPYPQPFPYPPAPYGHFPHPGAPYGAPAPYPAAPYGAPPPHFPGPRPQPAAPPAWPTYPQPPQGPKHL